MTFLTFHIFSFSVKYLHIIQVFEVHFFIGPLNMNILFMPQNVTEHKHMNCIHMYIVYKYRLVNIYTFEFLGNPCMHTVHTIYNRYYIQV